MKHCDGDSWSRASCDYNTWIRILKLAHTAEIRRDQNWLLVLDRQVFITTSWTHNKWFFFLAWYKWSQWTFFYQWTVEDQKLTGGYSICSFSLSVPLSHTHPMPQMDPCHLTWQEWAIKGTPAVWPADRNHSLAKDQWESMEGEVMPTHKMHWWQKHSMPGVTGR